MTGIAELRLDGNAIGGVMLELFGIELTAAGARGIRIEVIRERQVRASPRGRLVDAQAGDEVIGAARDGVDWDALDG